MAYAILVEGVSAGVAAAREGVSRQAAHKAAQAVRRRAKVERSAWQSETSSKPPYHYTECGLDDIYLCGGYDIEPTPYGEAVSIKYEEELLEAIGIFLVTEKKVLSGKELRFLRKQMDLTQAELGRWVGLSAQQVARWEKDQYDIPGPADHLLRILYLEHLGRSINVRELIAALEETDSETSLERHEFVRTNEGWRPKLAA